MQALSRNLILLFCLFSFGLSAQIRLPRLVSDGMVLQRDEEVRLWGWASPGEKIELRFQQKKYKTTADAGGNWEVTLPAQSAGGPYAMTLRGKNEVELNDVLFGDVWFCSGQSNMVHQMKLHRVLYEKEIAEADNTEIRHFWIPTTTSLTGPSEDFREGEWKQTNPENVRDFSAVAYFFALKLYEKYQVPIGLINASVGGTPIEAWTSAAGLQEFPELAATIETNRDTVYINRVTARPPFNPADVVVKDKGLTGPEPWFSEAYKPAGWKPINLPGYWEDQGIRDLNGTVWYRRDITVPAAMAGRAAEVYLGRIIDADELYINGEQVGRTTYQYPQRRYAVTEKLLRAGKNTFVVKVTNFGGKGGFVPDKSYYLFSGRDTVDLMGTWHYRVGEVFVPRSGGNGRNFSAQNQPASLYNGMVAPATNYTIKGILWYQGESNSSRPQEYAKLQPAQIHDWRARWGLGELPFLFVQLPNFMDANYLPEESSWAQLRDAQLSSLSVPNTAMAVAIDLGEWNDIHPDNKRSVGERLAVAADKLVYGADVTGSGPYFKTAERTGNKVVVSFSNVGGGLISDDGEPLRQFAVAGADQEYVWADAKIVGDKLEISSPEVDLPVYLRYAWADNPDVNFYNEEGLPASPFQTELPAPPTKLWQGKKAAVVLTYDDALNVHLDNAIPELDARGLKGTFYLSAYFPGSRERISDWRRAAARGHELGNHTLYHPCDASLPGREWVAADNDLSKYTTAEILEEIHMTNVFLEAIDGKHERTFAYTCGDTKTSEGSFVSAIEEEFVAARGVRGQLNTINGVNLMNVDAYGVNGETGQQLIEWVKAAEEQNALLTILFHGVGGEHSLNVSLEAHRELLDYLAANKDEVWTTTMLEAAQHILELKK